MLFKFDKSKKQISPLEKTKFSAHKILERQDMEKWIEENSEILGEELLIIPQNTTNLTKQKRG